MDSGKLHLGQRLRPESFPGGSRPRRQRAQAGGAGGEGGEEGEGEKREKVSYFGIQVKESVVFKS